jgi:hypothetical protein
VLQAVVYITNRTATQTVDSMILYKAFIKEVDSKQANKPSVLYLQVLGCKTYIYISKEQQITSYKVVPRAEVGILVSYNREYIYKVYIPTKARDKIVQLSNIQFDKGRLITDSLSDKEQLLGSILQQNYSNRSNKVQNYNRESNNIQ